jgi:hypothetical protein
VGQRKTRLRVPEGLGPPVSSGIALLRGGHFKTTVRDWRRAQSGIVCAFGKCPGTDNAPCKGWPSRPPPMDGPQIPGRHWRGLFAPNALITQRDATATVRTGNGRCPVVKTKYEASYNLRATIARRGLARRPAIITTFMRPKFLTAAITTIAPPAGLHKLLVGNSGRGWRREA